MEIRIGSSKSGHSSGVASNPDFDTHIVHPYDVVASGRKTCMTQSYFFLIETLPSELVTKSWCVAVPPRPSDLMVTSLTVAPGSGAPDSSVTVILALGCEVSIIGMQPARPHAAITI